MWCRHFRLRSIVSSLQIRAQLVYTCSSLAHTRLSICAWIIGQSPPFGGSFSDLHDCILDIKHLYHQKSRFSSETWLNHPVGEIVEVHLAQTGEGIAECEILKWFVQEGDQIEEFQRLCEVQSDKATIEITSRYKGKIHQIIHVPGDIVKVGDTLLKIILERTELSTSNSDIMGDTVLTKFGTLVENGLHLLQSEDSTANVLSTPSVRALAKKYGLNISHIKGTGKDGRILKEDVLNHASIKGASKEGSSMPYVDAGILDKDSHLSGEWSFEDKKILLRGFQRAMAKSMTIAARVPHFHYLEEIVFNYLLKLKVDFQNQNKDPEVKYTFLPFLIKSLSVALGKYPLLNSTFLEESDEVLLKGSHNIGVAMAAPCGLVVPNIKKVQSLSIVEISKELSRLQELASNNKLSFEDISGGTITLSNIGSLGGKFGCPLLNVPEVAIIAIGRIQKVPRFAADGILYSADIAYVVVGADHRVLDGATVARFCNEWKTLLEKPELLMLHMK